MIVSDISGFTNDEFTKFCALKELKDVCIIHHQTD